MPGPTWLGWLRARFGRPDAPAAAPADESAALADALRIARVGSWQWDPATDASRWSRGVYEIFGLDPSLPPPSFAEQRQLFASPGYGKALDQAVADAGGAFYELELEARHTSGAPIWIVVRGECLRDPGGRVAALRGSIQDVTARHLAEDARRRVSEARVRAIFDSTFQLCALLSAEGTMIEINATALSFAGVPAIDVVGLAVWETVFFRHDEQQRERMRIAVARAAAGEFVRFDVEAIGIGDRIMVLDFSLKPVRDDESRVHLLIAEGRDVTAERSTRQALVESEQRFRLAMRNAPIGKALVEPGGRWTLVNEALCEMLGYPEAQLLAMSFADLALPGDDPSDRRIDAALAAYGGDRHRGYERYRHADGHVVWAQLDVSVLRGPDGEPIQYILQLQDISERRHLEEEQRVLTQRLTLALHVSGIGVWDMDVDTGRLELDDASRRIFGWVDQADADDLYERVVAEDWPRVVLAIRATLAPAEGSAPAAQAVEFRVNHPRLGLRYIECTLGPVIGHDGVARRVVGVNFDVTERWEAEQRISESRALLRNLIDHLPLWVSMIDRQRRYAVVNRRAAGALQGESRTIEGRGIDELATPLPSALLDAREHAIAGEAMEYSGELLENGEPIHLHGVFMPIEQGPQAGYTLGVFSDVTALKHTEARLAIANQQLQRRIAEVLELQEKLREQAIRDGLTGLYNRRYFDEALANELARAERENYSVSLVMADLDHFKQLNDRHGHLAGDAVLQAWSELMRRSTRSSDTSCRYGGEEFVLVLPRATLVQAQRRAERLRARLEALTVVGPAGQRLQATVSLGVAEALPGRADSAALIAEADAAMYRAKQQGRNRVVAAPRPEWTGGF